MHPKTMISHSCPAVLDLQAEDKVIGSTANTYRGDRSMGRTAFMAAQGARTSILKVRGRESASHQGKWAVLFYYQC